MKTEFEPKELLGDMMREGAPANLRDILLGETLQVVRQRRRTAKLRLGVGIALVVVGAVLLFPRKPHSSTPPSAIKSPEPATYRLVLSQPLPASELVETKPFAEIETALSPAVNLVSTTTASGKFIAIGDDQLLALVSAHPAVLVRNHDGSELLVFADPNDEKNFVIHY